MKFNLYIIAGSVFLFAFTGGSNLIASYMLDIQTFSSFSKIHISAVYWSALASLAIQYTAPRIATTHIASINSENALFSLSLYSTIIFSIGSLITFKITEVFLGWHSIDVYIISLLAAYISFTQNVYGIIVALKKYTESALFIVGNVTAYLFTISILTSMSYFHKKYWLIGIVTCYIISLALTICHPHIRFIRLGPLIVFLRSIAVTKILVPSIIGGLLNGIALLTIYAAYATNTADEDVALFGYALLFKIAAQFISNIVNKVIFIELSHRHQIGKFNLNVIYIYRTIMKNLLSTLFGITVLWALYYILFDEYFYKYSQFPAIGYTILFAWISLEILYFVLYQFVQVNGYMWHSIIFISIPSILYAFTINLYRLPTSVIDGLLNYTGLAIVSNLGVLIVIYCSRGKHEGSRDV